MQRVGPHEIPFPYAAYPLQVHAMTALRDFLDESADTVQVEGSASGLQDGAAATRTHLAVLEAPTGTGKSQMLLNSVLSHLFAPVYASADTLTHSSSAGTTAVEGNQQQNNSDAGTLIGEPHKSPTLEDVLRQRQLEAELAHVQRERKARVRVQRRRLRQARQLMRHTSPEASGDTYLLAQDPLDWLAEHPQLSNGGAAGTAVSRCSIDSFSRFSSSSSSGSEEEEKEDDHADVEEVVEGALATTVALRKPKVYMASRTHTQLQQLMEDLQKTAFATLTLVPTMAYQPHHTKDMGRQGSPLLSGNNSGAKSTSEGRQATESARRLSAVHVAGRQHLCLNASIRQKAGRSGGGDMLNNYCREAMRYERSKEGRQARRRQEQTQQQQGMARHTLNGTDGQTRDIEDLPSSYAALHGKSTIGGGVEEEGGKGCAYCAESHLRSLLDFLKAEQQEQDQQDKRTERDANNPAKDPSSVSVSIYTMERLRHLGQELQACPYLVTRLLLRGADVAFVPYGYLLEEQQRAALLGGVTTNPATAAEAAAVGAQVTDEAEDLTVGTVEEEKMKNSVFTASASTTTPSMSLASVFYHRRQRVTATAAFRCRQQQQQKKKTNENGVRKTAVENGDEVWQVLAQSAPPSFRGDILVFDEAHNLADHCRSISTVQVSSWHLRLTQALCQVYQDRYEARLLTRNKQRLRELVRFTTKLLRFCTQDNTPSASATTASIAAGTEGGKREVQVVPFHTFLFDADIDNVDVHALLTFLVDSQLLMKLPSYLGHCVEKEEEEGKKMSCTEGSGSGSRSSLHQELQAQVDDGPDIGTKRPRASKSGKEKEASAERQRQRRFLASLSEEATPSSTAPSTAPITELVRSLVFGRTKTISSGERSNSYDNKSTSSSASAAAVSSVRPVLRMDSTRLHAIAAEALQHIDRLLQSLYFSDRDSTRVLLTSPPPSNRSSLDAGMDDDASLKLIQLEPGAYTFAPLLREARAVVLAGGTMQPLGLSCGPLLTLESLQTATKRMGNDGEGREETRTPVLPLRLITEGHVVPPSSVRVWTLGTGPSGLRIELSQNTLGSHASSSFSTTAAAGANRLLSEVGCTLLNLMRVLPAAGVICFCTSYDMVDRLLAVLRTSGYYDQIDEVKKIFCEIRSSSRGADDGGTGAPSAKLLSEYHDWIYGAASRRGALLFAVMGGRLSEGINFADDLGRAVIVLGMPYANPTDVELQLSLRHIARTRLGDSPPLQQATPTAASSSTSPFSSSAEWGLYMDAMMRVVNQSIGRCIRHAGDHAVVVLLDARYGERAEVRRRVSGWLQPSLCVAHGFGECFSGIRQFFADRRATASG